MNLNSYIVLLPKFFVTGSIIIPFGLNMRFIKNLLQCRLQKN